MIEKVIESWHQHLKGELPGGLDALLADDVVFYSPVVFTPQRGKEITKLYLQAAANTFEGDASRSEPGAKPGGGFHYTKQVMAGNQAVLEFEAEMGGKFVNGVDIITCNAEGQITEFRVMLRPLQAVNVAHQQMAAMLAKMKGVEARSPA
jgi:hypothetical protein